MSENKEFVFRIPKHVDERETLLFLRYREWLYMLPFGGLSYLEAFFIPWWAVKIPLITFTIGFPWLFLAQKIRGRQLVSIMIHRYRFSREKSHVYRQGTHRMITTYVPGYLYEDVWGEGVAENIE